MYYILVLAKFQDILHRYITFATRGVAQVLWLEGDIVDNGLISLPNSLAFFLFHNQ